MIGKLKQFYRAVPLSAEDNDTGVTRYKINLNSGANFQKKKFFKRIGILRWWGQEYPRVKIIWMT